MKTIRLLPLLLCLLCGGCSTYEIPVVRPSTWNPDKLRAAAVGLSSKYHTKTILTIVGERGDPVRLDPWPLTDEKWRDNILQIPKKGSEDWNWDAGTTARIRIHLSDGPGNLIVADIEYVKDGKVVAKWHKSGGFELFGYYRDMKKLGIYIP